MAGYLLGDVGHAERIGWAVARLDPTVGMAIREAIELIECLPDSDVKRDLLEELEGYRTRLGIDC